MDGLNAQGKFCCAIATQRQSVREKAKKAVEKREGGREGGWERLNYNRAREGVSPQCFQWKMLLSEFLWTCVATRLSFILWSLAFSSLLAPLVPSPLFLSAPVPFPILHTFFEVSCYSFFFLCLTFPFVMCFSVTRHICYFISLLFPSLSHLPGKFNSVRVFVTQTSTKDKSQNTDME